MVVIVVVVEVEVVVVALFFFVVVVVVFVVVVVGIIVIVFSLPDYCINQNNGDIYSSLRSLKDIDSRQSTRTHNHQNC